MAPLAPGNRQHHPHLRLPRTPPRPRATRRRPLRPHPVSRRHPDPRHPPPAGPVLPRLSYQRPIPPDPTDRYSDANPLITSVAKDLVWPISLILVGTAAQFLYYLHLGAPARSVAFHIGSSFITNLLIMLVGVVIAARVLSVTFGPVPTALLKLGAIAIGPGGLATVASALAGGGIGGALLALLVFLIAYFALLSYLFDLDPEEVWQTTIILFATRFVANIFLALVF